MPVPRSVGQLVPEFGRDGAAGVGVGAVVPPPGQVQSVSVVQDEFRQKPPEQTRSVPQLALLPQVPPQRFGVAEGLGVAVGVAVPAGVPVGDSVGVSSGGGVSSAATAKLNAQAAGAPVGEPVGDGVAVPVDVLVGEGETFSSLANGGCSAGGSSIGGVKTSPDSVAALGLLLGTLGATDTCLN